MKLQHKILNIIVDTDDYEEIIPYTLDDKVLWPDDTMYAVCNRTGVVKSILVKDRNSGGHSGWFANKDAAIKYALLKLSRITKNDVVDSIIAIL